MRDPGKRARAAVANIRGRARDGTRGSKTAEERRDHIGDSLANQLLVRVVLRTGHPVRDHRREQRLDGAQQRDGESGCDQRKYVRQRQVW